jgi:hypothetical protein
MDIMRMDEWGYQKQIEALNLPLIGLMPSSEFFCGLCVPVFRSRQQFMLVLVYQNRLNLQIGYRLRRQDGFQGDKGFSQFARPL